MKTSNLIQNLRIAGLSLGVIIALTACSSSQEQQSEQGNELQENGEENAANAEEQEQGGEENAVENSEAPINEELAENTGAEENLGAEGNSEAAPLDQGAENIASEGNQAAASPMNQVADPAPTNAAPINEVAAVPATPSAPAAPAAPAGDGSRVVRFITMDGTTVHGQADAAAPSVGGLNQGDAVVVSIMGGWGMIADGRYVQIDKLSETAVPRTAAANSWN